MRRALITGGTGAVGREVVRQLSAAGVSVLFTYHRNQELANVLTQEYGAAALQVDLAGAEAPQRVVEAARGSDVFVHCAQTLSPDWQPTLAVNVLAAVTITESLAPADTVLVGTQIGARASGLPLAFLGAQGLTAAVVSGLARQLRRRVNMVSLGLLDEGLSAGFDKGIRELFVAHSAVGRLGTPAEVARAIVWLALHNTYMTGKVLPVSGGL